MPGQDRIGFCFVSVIEVIADPVFPCPVSVGYRRTSCRSGVSMPHFRGLPARKQQVFVMSKVPFFFGSRARKQ